MWLSHIFYLGKASSVRYERFYATYERYLELNHRINTI